MKTHIETAWRIMDSADLICSEETVQHAISDLANHITADLRQRFPLVITVMNGGMMFAGHLLPKLNFPLSCDYIHATRYNNSTHGSDTINWIAMPAEPVKDRFILLLDDILDEGYTLAAIREKLLAMGASHVACAVLTNKDTGHQKPVTAEYVGLQIPNRYVFGCGMDVNGAWRNLPAIYAMRETATPAPQPES